MKCPKCSQDMEARKVDESSDPKTGKKYERTLYVCGADDVWVSVEVPSPRA